MAMLRIKPERCTCCESATPEFASEAWPSVRLCFRCLRDTIRYIVEDIGITDGNPILLEFMMGVEASREDACRIWLANPDGSYRECWVKYKLNPAAR